MFKLENLKGKTAFITGGASGIGLALAQECGKEGMNLVVVDLRQEAIDAALPSLSEFPVLAMQLDVTDREGYASCVAQAKAKFGNIHLLANNAGIGGARGPLWEVSYDSTDLCLDINLTAVLTGIHLIVPDMIKHGEGGYVVNTASKAGLIAVPGCGLYNLTKQALTSLSETMATDLEGTKVGCACFFPGPFKSNLGQTSGDVERQLLGDKAPPPPPPPPALKEGEELPPMPNFDEFTRPASDAAKRILRGVRRGDLYIITHTEFKEGFEERVHAMLRAFPGDKPKEGFEKAFGFLVKNPVFNKQENVPAMDDDKK